MASSSSSPLVAAVLPIRELRYGTAMRSPVRSALLVPLLALAGCGGGAIDAPSLATRAVERQPIPLPDEARESPTAADPVITTQIATIIAAADASHRRFEQERARAAATVAGARGSAAGSEAWIVAQQAVTVLDAARGPVRDSSAQLEALRQEPAGFGSGSRAAIDAAATKLDALVGAEAAAVAELSARLS